jgi:hypothetical protein
MRTSGSVAAALSVLLAATACSSGAAKVLVQDTSSPPVVATHSQSPTAQPKPASSKTAKHVAVATSTGPTATQAAAAATAPPPTTAPRPKASKTATQAAACTTLGPTTTMQMVTPNRFSPSSLTINRCDAVKAVYADTNPARPPHNWQRHRMEVPRHDQRRPELHLPVHEHGHV